mmetsp:Transcript_56829/g.159556  ORF Transcript_56829/g.159556 Transcript_56829/m.159556 type:complete len:351 (-) Transcript_56829:14-1066(-)
MFGWSSCFITSSSASMSSGSTAVFLANVLQTYLSWLTLCSIHLQTPKAPSPMIPLTVYESSIFERFSVTKRARFTCSFETRSRTLRRSLPKTSSKVSKLITSGRDVASTEQRCLSNAQANGSSSSEMCQLRRTSGKEDVGKPKPEARGSGTLKVSKTPRQSAWKLAGEESESAMPCTDRRAWLWCFRAPARSASNCMRQIANTPTRTRSKLRAHGGFASWQAAKASEATVGVVAFGGVAVAGLASDCGSPRSGVPRGASWNANAAGEAAATADATAANDTRPRGCKDKRPTGGADPGGVREPMTTTLRGARITVRCALELAPGIVIGTWCGRASLKTALGGKPPQAPNDA